MRNTLRETVIGTIIVLGLMIVPSGIVGTIETHYSMNGVVIETIEETCDVVVRDTVTEDEWIVNAEGYQVGDNVKMYMFNGCTDNTIYDDEVVRIKAIN